MDPRRALVASIAVVLSLAISVAACGGGKPVKAPESESDFDTSPDPVAPPSPPPEPVVKKGPVYPAPFTWEEIRAATKSGRTYRYRVEVSGKPARERVVTFV